MSRKLGPNQPTPDRLSTGSPQPSKPGPDHLKLDEELWEDAGKKALRKKQPTKDKPKPLNPQK